MQEAATLLNLASWDPGVEDFVASALADSPEAFMLADSMISLSKQRDLESAIESLNSSLRRVSGGVSRVSLAGTSLVGDFSVSSLNVVDTEDDDEDCDDDDCASDKDDKDSDEDSGDEPEKVESKSCSPIAFL
jgi:hypothetical protein